MSVEPVQPLRTSRLSLAQQAQHYLLGLIQAGTYQPGDQLPSQSELAAQLGISRLTLREALLNLEQEGAIVLRHGVGTFVAQGYPRRVDSGLEHLESVLEMAAQQGLVLQFSALRVKEELADQELAHRLEVPFGTPLTSVCRVIASEGKPIAYLLDFVLASCLSPGTLDEGFNGSVLDLLRHTQQCGIGWAVADIVAVNADGDVAGKLCLAPGEAILLLEEVLYDQQGTAIGLSRNYFVPAYFHFHVVRRKQWPEAAGRDSLAAIHLQPAASSFQPE